MFSKKEQWRIFIIVNAAFLLLVLLFPLYKRITEIIPLGECIYLNNAHLYCFGCGGTRALNALLHLDILGAFKYNPIVPMGAMAMVLYEIAMIRGLVRGKPRDTFIKVWMVIVFLGIWFIYVVVRNVLLFYGIDLLGDILI
ncbi:MAG: DUF2752 domain-containing protein [Clostridia bacterium]|nr:DUF2752 domain-containing protein [Clostridia bacterium]